MASHPTTFPCGETIEWIGKCIDIKQMTIIGSHGNEFVALTYPWIDEYYKLPKHPIIFLVASHNNFNVNNKDI